MFMIIIDQSAGLHRANWLLYWTSDTARWTATKRRDWGLSKSAILWQSIWSIQLKRPAIKQSTTSRWKYDAYSFDFYREREIDTSCKVEGCRTETWFFYMLWCRTIACKSDIPIWFGTVSSDISNRKRAHKLCVISWREDRWGPRQIAHCPYRRNWAEEMNYHQ